MSDFNTLSLQKGRSYKLNDSIVIRHPTLAEVEEFENEAEGFGGKGFEHYNAMVSALTTCIKDYADVLWFENNIWYEDIKSEWDFFLQRALVTAKSIKTYFKDQDIENPAVSLALDGIIKQGLSYFLSLNGEFVFIEKEIKNSDKTQIVLFYTEHSGINSNGDECFLLEDNNFKFTEIYYNKLVEFLRVIHYLPTEYELDKCANRNAKIFMMKYSYKKKKKNKKTIENISIASINSALMARGLNTWDMPIYLFYDTFYRVNKILDYDHTVQALYSGNIDTKKNPINWEKVNWASIIKQ